MELREITHRIHYVGVNDREKQLFENLWPIPDGVSYNSFIVSGENKVALIDTVEIGQSRKFLESLRQNTGASKIDYLVINHMEPDHSGSIRNILSLFPDIKIVGNSKTIQMVEGYYHPEKSDLYIEIKEGDVLDLGGISLKFFMTPMVHWPETMMTYCEQEKVIFSGDAFGTFGALNGGLTDAEMDCGKYIEEMYRYYSNIVGKYGRFVLNALKKIEGIDLEYICSTHGPIWHQKIPEVMKIVKKLASYEPEPGVTVIFGSMYGNTAELADLIATELNKRGVRRIKVYNARSTDLSYMISDAFRYEGLIVGSPTYSNEVFPPVQNFLNALKTREIKNRVTASFGSFGWAPLAAKAISEFITSLGLESAGSMTMKQSMTESTRKDVAELVENFVNMLKK